MKDVREVETFKMLSDNVVSGTEELGRLGPLLCLKSIFARSKAHVKNQETAVFL